MATNGIASIVTPIVTVLVLSALFRAAQRAPAVAPDGSMRLTYGRGMVGIGAIVLVFVLVLVGLVIKSPPRGWGEALSFVALLVGFGSGGIYLLGEAWRSALEVSPQGVVSMSPWRRPRMLRWQEITTVRFSPTSGYVILENSSGDKIRVSALYTGFGAFLGVLLERVGSARAAGAVERAYKYLGRMRDGRSSVA